MTDQKVAIRHKKEKLLRRRKHTNKKLYGTMERPRLVVYSSNRHIYAQLRDDQNSRTITGCSSLSPALHDEISGVEGNVAKAGLIGKRIAELAKTKGITKVSFDRNGRKYHGQVKALAEEARKNGLDF